MAPRKKKAEAVEEAPVNVETEAMKLQERLGAVVHRLESEVQGRITKRQPLEDRWIEDLQQYHGQYDALTSKALNDGQKSKLFINLTRPKTDAMSARLMDLLFPTDDRNWGIQPTPVPLLNDHAALAVKALREIEDKLKASTANAGATAAAPAPAPAPMAANDDAPADPAAAPAAPAEPDPKLNKLQSDADYARLRAKELQEIIEEASKRAEAMTNEIDDQLKASNYHASMRDVIDDACKIGTGVCKGPMAAEIEADLRDLERPSSPEHTAHIRGRISAYRKILTMADAPPVIEASTALY